MGRLAKSTPYGVVEMNFATWTRNGRVPSQLPLSDQFTKQAPCENGMWLVYDELKKEVRKPTAVTENMAIVYSSEKDYGMIGQRGLGYFCQVEGDYPRMGRPSVGDKYTTNTIDLGSYANAAAVATAVNAGTVVYVIPDITTGVPKLSSSDSATATLAGKVVKVYTVPNGDVGFKIEIIRAQ